MPVRWKIFQVICIMQLVFSALHVGYSFIWLFARASVFDVLEIACFLGIALFSSQGVSIINYNYPDVLIEGRQKRNFNILYLFNFFMVSFLAALLIREFRQSAYIWSYDLSFLNKIIYSFELVLYLFMFVFEIIILYGMFRLRRLIYANYHKNLGELVSGEAAN
jgi:hypothetical protein